MKHLDISEIIAGLVLENRLSADYIHPDLLHPPYDMMVSMVRDDAKQVDVIDKIGLPAVISARDAASTVRNVDPKEMIELLNKAYKREEHINKLTAIIRNLKNGDDLDVLSLTELLEKDTTKSGKYFRMDELDDESPFVWRKTYFPPIDDYIGDPENGEYGGVPESGLVVIGGAPGTGKTSLFLTIAYNAAMHDKKILIYTLEMTNLQITKRLMQISNKSFPKDKRKNIILCEDILSIKEVYADAMRLCALEDVHFVGIDFADLLIEGIEDEQSVAMVYRIAANLSKKNASKAPVFLLSQLNRNYTGGVPKINHLRYSSLAEAMASLILLVYNPNQIFAAQGRDDRLPMYPGRGYIIVGKSRFGFRSGVPGAIMLDFDGKSSWGNEGYGYTPLTSV